MIDMGDYREIPDVPVFRHDPLPPTQLRCRAFARRETERRTLPCEVALKITSIPLKKRNFPYRKAPFL
jgi:hypothetical protein